MQAVDTEAVVKRIADALQGSTKERGAKITIGKLPHAWGDPSALEQVFGNLLSNAVNYLDAKRSGLIEVSAVRSPHAEPVTVTYQIKDNGVGIPALHQAKVFQAFQRLQPELAKGEGMGLTMTRRIVERHNGRVWLESVEGAGTTFFVTLPAPPVEASSPAKVTASAEKCSTSHSRERRLTHAG
jgi:signal transduction histidine kinase